MQLKIFKVVMSDIFLIKIEIKGISNTLRCNMPTVSFEIISKEPMPSYILAYLKIRNPFLIKIA